MKLSPLVLLAGLAGLVVLSRAKSNSNPADSPLNQDITPPVSDWILPDVAPSEKTIYQIPETATTDASGGVWDTIDNFVAGLDTLIPVTPAASPEPPLDISSSPAQVFNPEVQYEATPTTSWIGDNPANLYVRPVGSQGKHFNTFSEAVAYSQRTGAIINWATLTAI